MLFIQVRTRRACSGTLSRIRNSALAAPVGQRLPCPQLRIDRRDQPLRVFCSYPRISLLLALRAEMMHAFLDSPEQSVTVLPVIPSPAPTDAPVLVAERTARVCEIEAAKPEAVVTLGLVPLELHDTL